MEITAVVRRPGTVNGLWDLPAGGQSTRGPARIRTLTGAESARLGRSSTLSRASNLLGRPCRRAGRGLGGAVSLLEVAAPLLVGPLPGGAPLEKVGRRHGGLVGADQAASASAEAGVEPQPGHGSPPPSSSKPRRRLGADGHAPTASRRCRNADHITARRRLWARSFSAPAARPLLTLRRDPRAMLGHASARRIQCPQPEERPSPRPNQSSSRFRPAHPMSTAAAADCPKAPAPKLPPPISRPSKTPPDPSWRVGGVWLGGMASDVGFCVPGGLGPAAGCGG